MDLISKWVMPKLTKKNKGLFMVNKPITAFNNDYEGYTPLTAALINT